MNWDKIKEQYLKAWELFWQSDYYGLQRQNHRIFFDFFDEQGVFIVIDFNFHDDEKIWDYSVIDEVGYNQSEDLSDYKTRTEAEEKAFEKAFEILENKLEGEK